MEKRSILSNILKKLRRKGEKGNKEKKQIEKEALLKMINTADPSMEGFETKIIHEKSNSYVVAIPRRKDHARFSVVYESYSRKNTKKESLYGSDYDLAFAERFYEKEGIIRKFVVTATAKALRAKLGVVRNPEYIGKNKERDFQNCLSEYKRILKNSKITHFELVKTILKELYGYGNSFILKNRKNKKIESIITDDPLYYFVFKDETTGEVTGYTRNPYIRPRAHSEAIVNNILEHKNLFPRLTQTSMRIREQMTLLGFTNERGSTSNEKKIPPEDVIHIKYMIEKNAALSMPPAMASIQDIEHLRTLEESLILLGWQYGNPILLITINTEGMNQTAADEEANRVAAAVNQMDSVGYLIGSHRLDVKLMYPSGSNVPLEKFVEHMTKRVIRGIDTPALFMGDGADAGRQAGETIESITGDLIMMTVQTVAEKLEDELLSEIVLNLGMDVENMPFKIQVREIDRNLINAERNFLTNMVNLGVIPPQRLLSELGMRANTPEEERMLIEYMMKKKGVKEADYIGPSNQYGPQTPGSVKD